jgi:hypothetical protein
MRKLRFLKSDGSTFTVVEMTPEEEAICFADWQSGVAKYMLPDGEVLTPDFSEVH